MPVSAFKFQPTLIKDQTELQAKGSWVTMQWMRFHLGSPEDILGYQAASLVDLVTGTSSYVVATDGTIPGITRGLHSWADNTGLGLVAAGGSKKLAVLKSGALYDITPFSSTATYSNPFITSSGSPTITINLGTTTHTATDGDTVVFSGAGTVGGVAPAGPYVVTYLSGTSYSITAASTATAAGTGGGTAVVAEYELAIGNVNGLGGLGYGIGGYGVGGYGAGTSTTVTYPRTWSLDNFGQYLIGNPRGGKIYEWQLNTGVRAQPVSNAPSQVNFVFMTPENFVVAAGAHDGSAFDPLLVRWSDQGIDTTWTPTATNLAGDQRLSIGSRIVAGVACARESLIFTDRAVYAMRALTDASLVYGFTLLGVGCGLIGPNAVAVVGGAVYWMSINGDFWVYDGGAPRLLITPVTRYVADAITAAQQEKIYASRNGMFSEVWWLYPAGGNLECTNYVAYNYQEGGWFAGTIGRTAMVDAGIDSRYPIMAGSDSLLYIHEIGNSANGAAISAYIQSAPFNLADGQELVEVLGFLPDFKDQSTNLQLTISTRDQAQGALEDDGPYTFGTSGNRIDTRASGRQAQIKLSRNDNSGRLIIGEIRLDIQPLGDRP